MLDFAIFCDGDGCVILISSLSNNKTISDIHSLKFEMVSICLKK